VKALQFWQKMICGCAGHILALYAGYWQAELLRAKDHIVNIDEKISIQARLC
jgi:hypothetical protein